MKIKVQILFLVIAIFAFQDVYGQKLNSRKVRKIFEQSSIMQEHFVGFMLQEDGGKIVYEQNPDKYFVPASNTKLLTLYTALNILGDSVPALKYEIKGDSLIFWGTGDPSFLHPKLDNRKVYDFLAKSPYKLFLADEGEIDFEPSPWRADLSHLPIYGNETTIKSIGNGGLSVQPKIIEKYLSMDTISSSRRFRIQRAKYGTQLLISNLPVPEDLDIEIPFPMDMQVTQVLLQDTLKKNITLIKKSKPIRAKILYSIPSDSLYRHMMLPSDNFLAEQILLLCADKLSDTLDVDIALDYSKKNILANLKNEPEWVDGSGLSRYNIFTPNAILEVLNLLEREINSKDRLKSLLPAGGVSGTIRNAYKTDNGKPFVWAKTGTLMYMHLQSGWVETRKGKTYRFVFMNNNFVRPTSDIRNEMVRIMTKIHEDY